MHIYRLLMRDYRSSTRCTVIFFDLFHYITTVITNTLHFIACSVWTLIGPSSHGISIWIRQLQHKFKFNLTEELSHGKIWRSRYHQQFYDETRLRCGFSVSFSVSCCRMKSRSDKLRFKFLKMFTLSSSHILTARVKTLNAPARRSLLVVVKS